MTNPDDDLAEEHDRTMADWQDARDNG